MDGNGPPLFLKQLLSRYVSEGPLTRPYVTLTFAQSLDAKIAGAQGRQLILSGEESMVMTHWMRTLHDAILIGIGTALNDDPQLNVRHLPPRATPYNLPRPIVIDTFLRMSPTCKLLNNYKNGIGRRPWVICGAFEGIPEGSDSPPNFAEARLERKEALEAAGARVLEIPVPSADKSSHQLSVPVILRTLKENGISSVMVEGGAEVISSFMQKDVVDRLIITIAPTLVGDAGVGYRYPASPSGSVSQSLELKHAYTEIFGKDSVVAFSKEDTQLDLQKSG